MKKSDIEAYHRIYKRAEELSILDCKKSGKDPQGFHGVENVQISEPWVYVEYLYQNPEFKDSNHTRYFCNVAYPVEVFCDEKD